jgi:hypothetical protein
MNLIDTVKKLAEKTAELNKVKKTNDNQTPRNVLKNGAE